MNREVFWTAEARSDVSAIVRHIVRHIARNDPKAAERVAGRIFDAGKLLGQGVPGRSSRMADSFEKVVRGLPYILAYDVVTGREGDERIIVLHVVHGARDWIPDRWPPI